MRHFSAAQIAAAFFSILLLGVWVGCSGTSSTPNAVTSIVMTPALVSMNIGQVVQITGVPKDYAGNTIVADMNYSSSNPAKISISPTGYICAGVWDVNYITCTALPGQTGVATATITANSGTVTATAPVFSHLQVDQISVSPPTGCVSVGATPSYSATAYNTTAPGCSVAIPCDITPTVGPITYYSTNLVVMTNNVTTGILTASEPGSTSIYASVAGLNSTPQPALVCPVVSINVHDANSTNTTFNLAPTATQLLVADVIDSAGIAISPNLTWNSVPSGVASISLGNTTGTGSTTTPNTATVTANTAGTTAITATCSTPDCNVNISPQYAQNVVTTNVSGTTTTTVYAASTKSLTLMPITTSNNTVGTAIALPYMPNSIFAASSGSNIYLGSATGIMNVSTLTAGVTVSAAALGQIVAASPSGEYLLVSDSVNRFVYVFDTASSTVILTQSLTASAAAFTPDNKSVSFLAPGNQLYYDTAYPTSTLVNLPYVPNSLDTSAQGGYTYVTSAALGAIDIRSTCNQASWRTLAATAPTLVAHLPNGNGAVVADSPSIDVVTTGAIPPGCPPTAQSTVSSYNLGYGNFTATQMFVSTDSTRVFVLSNLNSIIGLNLSTLTPFSIPLSNGALPTTGGIMIDGSMVYVGGTDNNVHAINPSNGTDTAQIAPGLKDSGGNVVVPDLVLVLPK